MNTVKVQRFNNAYKMQNVYMQIVKFEYLSHADSSVYCAATRDIFDRYAADIGYDIKSVVELEKQGKVRWLDSSYLHAIMNTMGDAK